MSTKTPLRRPSGVGCMVLSAILMVEAFGYLIGFLDVPDDRIVAFVAFLSFSGLFLTWSEDDDR